MLTVGDRIPNFDVQAMVSTDMEKAFQHITAESDADKWKIVFFWLDAEASRDQVPVALAA